MARRVEPNNSDVVREWDELTYRLDNSTMVQAESFSGYVDMDIEATSNAPTRLGVPNLGFNPFHLPNNNCYNFDEEVGSESVDNNMNEEFVDNLGGSNASFHKNVGDPPRLNKDMEDSDYRSHRPFFNPNMVEPKQFSNQPRPNSFLNLSPPDYRKLASGQVLHYGLSHLTGFMSVRVKRSGTGPTSSPEVDNSPLSPSTTPDVNARICDNCNDIQSIHYEPAGSFIDSHPIPVYLVNQGLPTISNALVCKPEPHDNPTVIGKLGGLGFSQVVRLYPLAPGFDRGANRRRSVRSIKRVIKDKIQVIPGMKRKGLSNFLISCYPLWKRRMPLISLTMVVWWLILIRVCSIFLVLVK